jgi:acetylornithine deacetylase
MGRVLGRLETLDTALQAMPAHPLLGTASLHASTIGGGRELSVYPDACSLRLERRTLPGEPSGRAIQEVESILTQLRDDDPTFDAVAQPLFERPPHMVSPDHELPSALARVVATRCQPDFVGMSFWTDAAILGAAGIPAVLFGPGGDGLHSLEEYVTLDDVLVCRDVLVDLAQRFCVG